MSYGQQSHSHTAPLLVGSIAVFVLVAVFVRGLGANLGAPSVLDIADEQMLWIAATTTPSPAPSDEVAILSIVNDYREQRGLPQLVMAPSLRSLARAHSRAMSSEGFFGHVSPTGETFADRLVASGISYTAAAETLALAPTAEEAFQQFLDSGDHRERLVDPLYCEVGIGAYRGANGLIVAIVLAVDRPYGSPPSQGC